MHITKSSFKYIVTKSSTKMIFSIAGVTFLNSNKGESTVKVGNFKHVQASCGFSRVFFPLLRSIPSGLLLDLTGWLWKVAETFKSRVMHWHPTNDEYRLPNVMSATVTRLLLPQRFHFIPRMLPGVCFSSIIPGLVASRTHISFEPVHVDRPVGPLKVYFGAAISNSRIR